jgi:hypothetical protein
LRYLPRQQLGLLQLRRFLQGRSGVGISLSAQTQLYPGYRIPSRQVTTRFGSLPVLDELSEKPGARSFGGWFSPVMTASCDSVMVNSFVSWGGSFLIESRPELAGPESWKKQQEPRKALAFSWRIGQFYRQLQPRSRSRKYD